ncbi:hypothetical protein [Cryptosporidium parvum Iowa II]|uniref:Telomeric single stranded DNA binding POT1/Cdc13 domain-containing protein n=2 Tax=Cryptosporidium parvum TaxID=5807 RepID=Q5CR01_CRYPI|nr:hypothetical protein [Cryptosporidium parvum Iowa II]EAK87829.1 hypothetical protein cgd4_2650 [Cryptosporidium parvum Iowa II]QOY42175.1 Nucleic acid-binding OB-fold-containing protein [Cryptosporidium parvum]WKS77476.1 hypothetical protein CPCDC_4g2650 [Cryptosporidium sp. 43IA8]WRK31850.1 Nucleic acid-binding OB-fold-containing protein [Cryptosporidium parvum]|eukprot:QOY42175.1 hypothetical protein CPATCC_001788 [Cryptosporidium parvum]
MEKGTKVRNRTVSSSNFSSNGYLVLVTSVFNVSKNDNLNLDSKTNQSEHFKIIAQLTNSNRLYKISPVTKTLSENQNQIIYFDISLYNEWSTACSFVNTGDVIEIFGGYVSKNKNSITYEFSVSKRNSSMVVWRSGFEHIPAVLTHAAVLCSKGNIYLPAWARIYNDRTKLEPAEIGMNNQNSSSVIESLDFNGSFEQFNCITNNLDFKKSNEIYHSILKKRKASSAYKNVPQTIQYSYIDRLSDIIPKVSVNLYGVVLEVGNNPIKRCGSRTSQIFLNVTLIDPSVIELVPMDSYSISILDELLSGIYNYKNRPRLNPNFPTISLEIATEGDANTLPIINFGDIIRVHRVEPTISKQKYIDLPCNVKNTSIRVWSIHDLDIERIYSKYSSDEEIFDSQDCYFTVENAIKVGGNQQRTTFTKDDSLRLLKLQRWFYELFHDFPFFSISPYTKTLKYLSNSSENHNRQFGDIIVFIHDICILSDFFKKPTSENNKFQIEKKLPKQENLCFIVTEHKQCERINLDSLMKNNYDQVFIVYVSENHNFGLRDYFINNKKPLSYGDWIRIKNVSILGTDYFTHINGELVGPFTVIDTNRSRITRLPFWSGDVKLNSSRISPISKSKALQTH